MAVLNRSLKKAGVFVRLVTGGAILLSAVGLALAGESWAAIKKTTHVDAQGLGPALEVLAKEHGFQVLYRTEVVRGVRVHSVDGMLTTEEALHRLLDGTTLTYRYLGEKAVTIVPVSSAPSTGTPTAAIDQQDGEKQAGSFWDRFRMAQVGDAQNPHPNALSQPGGAGQAPEDKATLDEVIVTASKRPEALREVANSVTAFSGEQLTDLGAQSFQDYLSRAPGVIFESSTPGVANVTIRGIGTATTYPDQGQGTTGIYLNDIPLTDPGFAVSVPDLDVFDVQRVEVLKGPQGTLFGSATLGGAVNYILNPVSLTKYDAIAQVSGFHTQSSSDTGYTAKGAANIPLIDDVLGIRLTAIKRSDPGYLDNIGTGGRDTNTHDVEAARINALWKVSSSVKVDLFTFYDRSTNGDGFYAFPALGNRVRDTLIPEKVSFTTRISNLKLDADLGFATLTASVADSHKSQNYAGDLSPFYGAPTTTVGVATTHSQMAEVRLTSPGNQRFDWLVGAYYGWFDENYPSPTYQDGADVFDFNAAYRSNESAVFAEGTYRFNSQWRATVGGRSYDIRVRTNIVQGEPDVPDTPEEANTGWQKGSGFSPKASLTFEPNSMVMSYALVSKGFRMGGVNLVAPLSGFATPATYGSDHLVNYELGLRLTSPDRTLEFDTTAFFIDWSNIQLRLNRPEGFAYVANAGVAHSKGLENSLSWKPFTGLTLQAGLTYLEAALAESLNLGNGTTLPNGAVLPGASKWSTSETAEYRFRGRFSPHVLLSHRYLSTAHGDFSPELPVGNYHIVDLRGGIDVGQWGITAFVNNIGDRRGVTAAAFFGEQLTDFYVMPRTIGLQLDWRL